MQLDSGSISTIISSAVTIIVGFIAFYVYQKGRNDTKKDAARTIVLELKNAQHHLQSARESIIRDDIIKEDLFVLRSSQWERHKYLFARDLKADELAEIDLFYEKCILYDEIVRYNNTFFVKNEEQIRTNLQATLADFTKNYVSALFSAQQSQEEAIKKDYETYKDAFAAEFMNEVSTPNSLYFYRPQKTMSDAKAVIHTVNINITSTKAYERLQDLSTETFRTRILKWFSRDKERL